MEQIITSSIGIGLVVSLFFTEMLGLAAGGMVVPGYFALYLHNPIMIILTIAISYLTFFIIRALSSFIIIYGRRRTVLMILVGFLLGWFLKSIDFMTFTSQELELTVVGYIIPGLIAIWMDKQGVLETITTLLTSSIIVRLCLILIYGKEILL